MSSIPSKFSHERGVALFLGLIMLLIMTILGISSFQNAHIQERSAGNARLQSVAFEAAAAGATDAINFFNSQTETAPDQLCGSLGHEGWDNPTAWVDMGSVGEASLRQRMYCLADEYPDAEGGRPARSQLFVLSRGEVSTGGQVVAQRDIEVRLDVGAVGTPGDGCGALCFPGCEGGSYDFPPSNSFQVDGGGGPAITASCPDEVALMEDEISDNRLGNYIGGVQDSDPGLPWNSPSEVEAWRLNVIAAAQALQAAGACMTACYTPGNLSVPGNTEFGTAADPQITYIEGNADFSGTISGAGILVVNGNLCWGGTPAFVGLIVVLGGTYEICSGGGDGGDHAGSVVVLNAPGDGTFGAPTFGVTGGGTAEFNYSCEALQTASSFLTDTVATLDPAGQNSWNPDCNQEGSIWEESPITTIIASWRENIGWREEFFGSGE